VEDEVEVVIVHLFDHILVREFQKIRGKEGSFLRFTDYGETSWLIIKHGLFGNGE